MKITAYLRFSLSLFVMLSISMPTLSIAQERQMGGVGITVFADANFRGKSATFRQDMPDLRQVGLDKKISSLRVGLGEQWEVCERPNYQGRCVVVSGEEPDLRRNSWNKTISSIRRVGGASGPPSVLPAAPVENGGYIVLFDQPNYRGNPRNYKGSVPNLGFNRPVGSVTIGNGIWQICDGANFTGHCFVLNQSVADLRSYRLSGVASVRPWGGGSANAPAPPSQSDWYIVIYDQPNYRGSPRNYKTAEPNLAWNIRVQSVTIGKGVWEICEGANFTGRCATLDNSVPDLSSQGFRGTVRSLRPARPQPR